MATLVILLLFPLAFFIGHASDPIPGLWQSKEEARNLECIRLSQQEAHELRPDQVPEPFPRAEFTLADALACRRRFMALGERPARDELILSTLRESVGEITQQASALGLEGLTWHVDAFYPVPAVASKIAVAARNDLAEHGQKVSERVPLLAAGDLLVLGRMKPQQAYPLACARYFAQKALGENEAFLGLMIVDPREGQLHAGLCAKGEWRWLR
jgi:hypothetical protein